jgi:glycosyltransferase involved in cell wall biosynthesis
MVRLRAFDLRDMSTNVCLIIPCFNEAARLDFDQFADLPSGVTCLLVDDGSRDGTGDLVRRHESSALRVLDLPHNVGKAEAIRQGMLHAQTSGLLDQADWVGYWDADMATPLSELESFIAYAAIVGGHVDGIFGSRIDKLGSTIVRSYRRHLIGRSFATLASVLLGLECYDSQCGAKLFRTDLVAQAFDEPFLSRWIFDVEILVRLRERRLIEYPLRRWVDVQGSKVSIVKVAVPTLIDLVRIRLRYGRRQK